MAGLLLKSLRSLEYRGYDSTGIATLSNGSIARRRAEGKLRNLEDRLSAEPLDGTIGIGHTQKARVLGAENLREQVTRRTESTAAY